MTTRSLFLLITFLIASVLSTDIKFSAIPIHTKAEYGKVVPLLDGNFLITSNSVEEDKSYVSKINENAVFIYHNYLLNTGYTGSAQVTESKLTDGSKGYILYYKKEGKEMLAQFKDEEKSKVNLGQTYDTVHEQVSLLTLKNGKIFFMGITKPSNKFPSSQTHIELKIYDPVSL